MTELCLPGGAICRHVLACSAIVLVIVFCWGRDDDGAKASEEDATEATATDKCARERTIVAVSLVCNQLVGSSRPHVLFPTSTRSLENVRHGEQAGCDEARARTWQRHSLFCTVFPWLVVVCLSISFISRRRPRHQNNGRSGRRRGRSGRRPNWRSY